MKKKYGLLSVFVLICFAGAAFCGWNLYQELMPRVQAEKGYDLVRMIAFPDTDIPQAEADNRPWEPIPDFDNLQAWNQDVKAWIRSPGTDIDYPVMQGKDNDFYLNHTADRQQSIIGSIFMESQNRDNFQDDVTVLYGHHIRGGRMFSSLSGYKNQSYYEKHPDMYLYTPNQNYRVELFAGGILDGATGRFPLVFADETERIAWIDEILAATTFDSGQRPEEGTRIVALCTCTYEYRNARYVVYGILRELEEE
ncbi:MAG: class B sortase [Lachnospiraceae bacterium]